MQVVCPRDKRVLNWNPQAEDRNAIDAFCAPFAMCSASFADVVIPKNLKRDWLRTENQGNIGSCQGHSLTSAAEVLYWVGSGGDVVQLSRLHAYLGTQKIDGIRGDNGSTIAGGLEYAKSGFVNEVDQPYRGDSYPTPGEVARILAIPQDQQYAIKSGIKVESYQHGKRLVAGGMAISIGSIWPFEIGNDGIVRRWAPMSGGGGHARVICEITDTLLTERGSWGSQLEHIYWTENAFNGMLGHPYTVCLALSELANPVARNIDFTKELWK